MKDTVFGIDIGGTNTKVGLVDAEGHTHFQSSIKTNVEDARQFVQELVAEMRKALAETEGSVAVRAVGIGAPNANYYDGTIENPVNLQWGGITPLLRMLHEHFDLPMVLTNDANAAAVGELYYGNAKGMRDFVVVTLGTGLGSGIMVNGELLYGHDGFAGELGHTLVNVNGRYCGCGRRGCLETYVSATGIKRTAYKLLADFREDSELRAVPFDELTAAMITEAAIRGDKIAIEAFEYTGRVLGMKLADAVVHYSPEAIFLFGGLVKAGDYIFYPTKYHFEKNLMSLFKDKVQILPSGLMEKNAAILGAAALAWKELEKKAL